MTHRIARNDAFQCEGLSVILRFPSASVAQTAHHQCDRALLRRSAPANQAHGLLCECRERGSHHLLHLPEIQPGMENPHPQPIYTSSLTSPLSVIPQWKCRLHVASPGRRKGGRFHVVILTSPQKRPPETRKPPALYLQEMATQEKTFYLETFGCQMNAHDSEKVVGTLISQGYRQVPSVEEAGLVLYNTCSIRDKAEQKVFHRLADYKKLEAQGKKFGVLGCVAQQEGEKIFERAPHVNMVCGSASYRNLPEMLVKIEAGKSRVTGLDDRETDECFETEFTARTNPHRGYITIIEGCDKFCA